ncbi:MAG: hypothetical protein KY475_03850 [Planctomycetes bacterium]|nr:hypothetical protein [Planctomycetota bacterium]
MPLKLNVGLSQKVGAANYGSRGASVAFEVELEAEAVHDPDRLQGRIRLLWELARAAVEEELSKSAKQPATGIASANGQPSSSPASGDEDGDGYRDEGPPIVRPATNGQVRAIWGLAKRRGVNLPSLLRDRFRVDLPEELSLPAASSLIDELKANGER